MRKGSQEGYRGFHLGRPERSRTITMVRDMSLSKHRGTLNFGLFPIKNQPQGHQLTTKAHILRHDKVKPAQTNRASTECSAGVLRVGCCLPSSSVLSRNVQSSLGTLSPPTHICMYVRTYVHTYVCMYLYYIQYTHVYIYTL